MWGLFNYLWKNAAQASAGMQQHALWNLWTADCKRAGETLHLENEKGQMAAEDWLERNMKKEKKRDGRKGSI